MMKDRPLFFIKAIILFSMFDALCTDIGIKLGWVTEANPIAGAVYEWSILAFYGLKVLLPLTLLLLYPVITMRRFHQWLITMTAFIYMAVSLYHCVWMVYGWYVHRSI